MVLPSFKGRTWYPEHGITYIKEDGSEMEVVNQSKIMDIVVWVGDFEPKEDWEKLSNLSEMKIMYVSDSMMDWCNTNTSLNCSKLVDQMLEI